MDRAPESPRQGQDRKEAQPGRPQAQARCLATGTQDGRGGARETLTGAKGQIKALNLIESKDYDILIAGHGFLTGKSAITESKEYFALLNTRIREAIDDGIEASEITNLIKMEEFKDKAMFEILNKTNVSKAFYEVEFEE